MAKKKKPTAEARREARGQNPPSLRFKQAPDGMWVPIITLANLVMPLDPRPFMGFAKGERDAILTWIKQAMSEMLFDTPRYLVHPETGKSALNPDWDLLPYFEESPDNPGEFVEVTPRPGAEQIAAGDRLIVE